MTDKTDFITALTRQLRAWQDETVWLTREHVAEMLTAAAAEVLPAELEPVRLWREVNPEDMTVSVRLELAGPEQFTLWPEDVAVLRALLLSLDENEPAKVGELLAIPTRLSDGRIVNVVTEEML